MNISCIGRGRNRGFPMTTIAERDIFGLRIEIDTQNTAKHATTHDESSSVRLKIELAGASLFISRQRAVQAREHRLRTGNMGAPDMHVVRLEVRTIYRLAPPIGLFIRWQISHWPPWAESG